MITSFFSFVLLFSYKSHLHIVCTSTQSYHYCFMLLSLESNRRNKKQNICVCLYLIFLVGQVLLVVNSVTCWLIYLFFGLGLSWFLHQLWVMCGYKLLGWIFSISTVNAIPPSSGFHASNKTSAVHVNSGHHYLLL